jgi:hypothetical protein
VEIIDLKIRRAAAELWDLVGVEPQHLVRDREQLGRLVVSLRQAIAVGGRGQEPPLSGRR